eukprot:m.359889 g.359889  ORF g.359889 m.359889 type:complete len:238 (+) comp18794_c0_seq1:109-822(+)
MMMCGEKEKCERKYSGEEDGNDAVGLDARSSYKQGRMRRTRAAGGAVAHPLPSSTQTAEVKRPLLVPCKQPGFSVFRVDHRALRIPGLVSAKQRLIIDTLGAQSAKVQGLGKPVTSVQVLDTTDQVLYILSETATNTPVGLIKLGNKHLFMMDPTFTLHEMDIMCVLDFFILPDRQRGGLGRLLFDFALEDNGLSAVEVAIDAPSAMFRAFLKKHFTLHLFQQQSNNFVLFDEYWQQ